MQCEFCDVALPVEEPANIALLQHVEQNQACNEQFGYMIDNLGASWTRSMSGP